VTYKNEMRKGKPKEEERDRVDPGRSRTREINEGELGIVKSGSNGEDRMGEKRMGTEGYGWGL